MRDHCGTCCLRSPTGSTPLRMLTTWRRLSAACCSMNINTIHIRSGSKLEMELTDARGDSVCC